MTMPERPDLTSGLPGSHAITEVRIRLAPGGGSGLVAFASCCYGGVLLNDIAIRKDSAGHLFLTYPRKLSASGRPHPLHHPIDRETASEFEAAVIGQVQRLLGPAEGADGS
ncbi:MAG: septation protein SpoVG family protein [bacterium]|nr:septation protein SpoVG family protein [bacterium]